MTTRNTEEKTPLVIPDDAASGSIVGALGSAGQLRILNRPNKPWLRIEDATDPARLSLLINKADLLAALQSEGLLDGDD